MRLIWKLYFSRCNITISSERKFWSLDKGRPQEENWIHDKYFQANFSVPRVNDRKLSIVKKTLELVQKDPLLQVQEERSFASWLILLRRL